MIHTLTQERNCIINNVKNDSIVKEVQNLVVSQVRATAFIILNYINGPIRRLGVNGAIIDHIRHSLVMGVFTKQNKDTSVQAL